jgi:hypothetical protein
MSTESKDELKTESKVSDNSYVRIRLDSSVVPKPEFLEQLKKKEEKTEEKKEKKEEKKATIKENIEKDKNTLHFVLDDKKIDLASSGVGAVVNVCRSYTKNDFFNSVLHAYNNHIPLGISVDDISLAIGSTVAKYIDLNTDVCRKIFCHMNDKDEKEEKGGMSNRKKSKSEARKTADKIDLVVEKFGASWEEFIDLMNVEIKKSLTEDGAKILSALVNDYSISTPVSLTVSQIQIMSAVKTYCNYGFMMGCGMREVVLFGTTQDWEKLAAKYNKLKVLLPGLGWWYKWMDIIIDMLVNMRKLSTSSGGSMVMEKDVPQEYKEIWKRVATFCPQGSGGQTHLGGWIHMLAPYSSAGHPIVNENTAIYSPLMPTKIPPILTDQSDYYGYQDMMHEFYFGRDWGEVSKLISTANVDTDFAGKVTVESGFYGGVYFNVATTDDGTSVDTSSSSSSSDTASSATSSTIGVRPICGYRISKCQV